MKYNVREFANKPLYGLPVAVIDFETTGISPYDSKAVEMAIVHLDLGMGNAEVVYNERFNPGIPIPEGASNVHGIYTKDVQECSTFGESFVNIMGLLENRVLAAYNLSYDWTVLNCEYRKSITWHPDEVQRNPFGNQFFGLCGLVMAKSIDTTSRGSGYHRLSNVCERRGISLDNAHSAGADALATAVLLERLLKEVTERYGRFPTVRDFWAWQKSCAMSQERGLRDWLREKGKSNDVWPWTDY